MQIVRAKADCSVRDTEGRLVCTLRCGTPYVLYDREAGLGLRHGAVEVVEGLDRKISIYDGGPLHQDRLILFFIGKMGDGLVAGSCLVALLNKFPNVEVDIVCPPAVTDVFALLPRFGNVLPYPLEAAQLEDYDHYLTFEDIEATPLGRQRSYAQVFSACLRTPTPQAHAPIDIPHDVQQRWELPPDGRPRIALHAGRPESLRSYPASAAIKLLEKLVVEGFDVYLIGHRGGTHRATDGENHVYDLRGRTHTPADLAAVLAQTDALITGDSFPMHLAGALRIPTIALFTTTNAVIAADYASMQTVHSSVECSPCGATGASCPLGHSRCMAQADDAFSPDRLLEKVVDTLGVLR